MALVLIGLLSPVLELPAMRHAWPDSALSLFLWLRFGVLVPFWCVLMALAWISRVKAHLDFLLPLGLAISCIILAAAAQALNPVLSSPIGRVSGTVLPLMLAGLVALPMRVESALVSVVVASVGVMVVMAFGSRPTPTPYLLLGAAFVLIALGIAVSVGIASQESAAREVFMQRERLAQLNAELAASNRALALVNEQKNDFLAMAVHELRTPLTIVRLSADLLREGRVGRRPSDAELEKSLAGISDSVTGMNAVLTLYLQTQATLDGSLARRDEPVRLREAAAAAVRRVQPLTSAKGQAVEIAEAALDPIVRGDRGLVGQVLDNLLGNASKFSPPGSAIALRLSSDLSRGKASIGVSDSGPGLTAEDQKALFQKYSRLSAQPTGGESSTGLGLAIVKLLLDAMGGEVRCESEPGKGATFWVTLPLLVVAAA